MFAARLRADHKVFGALIADHEVCAAVALALAIRLFLRPVVWYRRQAGKQDGFADNKDGQQQAERTFAIHGSDSGFSDRLFMLEEPAFGFLVRTVGHRPPIFLIAPSHGTP
jgi:hypothetical protein